MFSVGTDPNNMVDYSVSVVSLKRQFNSLDRDDTDRSTITGTLIRNVIGSFFNYSVEVNTKRLNRAEYDSLYNIITSTNEFLYFKFPFGQNDYAFYGYVSTADDELLRVEGNKRFWGNLSFEIVPKSPKMRA